MRRFFPSITFVLPLVCLLGCGRDGSPGRQEVQVPQVESEQATPVDSPSIDSLGPEGAVAAIRRYYEAIQAREFPQAYRLWEGEGAASGQTVEDFEAGFAKIASVDVEIGAPGRIEGAAGSRYIEIPVRIMATTRDGHVQHFRGIYVLRRSVVDGASAEQRAWHIHSADISKLK